MNIETNDESPDAALDPLLRREFDAIWSDDREYVLVLASRMLGNRADAEDVVQEAFVRLAKLDLAEIDDVRGWLAVVVRRLCLDVIRSAHSRRESATGAEFDAATDHVVGALGRSGRDPADRVTLDDQVQIALSMVLDRLTPAERTAFVLHDVFGFPFADVAEIVGRTPAACRQLASRARKTIRGGATEVGRPASAPTNDAAAARQLTDQFMAACAGGDIAALMALLDPDVDGEASLAGHGPLTQTVGRPLVARFLIAMLGPGTGRSMTAFEVERQPAVLVYDGRRFAVILLDELDGRVRHIHTYIQRR